MAEKVVIPREGIANGTRNPRAIYSKITSRALQVVGEPVIRRASRVEPGESLSQELLRALPPALQERDPQTGELRIRSRYRNHWFVDLTPVAGAPKWLGPFPPDHRQAALAAEVAWLEEAGIPEPQAEAPRLSLASRAVCWMHRIWYRVRWFWNRWRTD